jgi:hypothetical protein
MWKWAIAALVLAFIAGAMSVIGIAVDIAEIAFYIFAGLFALLVAGAVFLYKKVT